MPENLTVNGVSLGLNLKVQETATLVLKQKLEIPAQVEKADCPFSPFGLFRSSLDWIAPMYIDEDSVLTSSDMNTSQTLPEIFCQLFRHREIDNHAMCVLELIKIQYSILDRLHGARPCLRPIYLNFVLETEP